MAKKKKGGSAWGKRYEGAKEAGYRSDQAAAIAHGGSNKESAHESQTIEGNLKKLGNLYPTMKSK